MLVETKTVDVDFVDVLSFVSRYWFQLDNHQRGRRWWWWMRAGW
jgi:hypothetical protein